MCTWFTDMNTHARLGIMAAVSIAARVRRLRCSWRPLPVLSVQLQELMQYHYQLVLRGGSP